MRTGKERKEEGKKEGMMFAVWMGGVSSITRTVSSSSL